MAAGNTLEELQRKADAKRREGAANTSTSSSAPAPAEQRLCSDCGVRPARIVHAAGVTLAPLCCEECSARLKKERARVFAGDHGRERSNNLVANLASIGVNVRKYGDASFAGFDPNPDRRAIEAARQFVADFRAGKGPSLYLYSDRPGETLAPGNGKTYLAVAVLRELVLDPNIPVRDLRFVFVPELLIEIQDTFNNPALAMGDVVRKYSEPELLVWDDLGSEKVSDFAVRTLYTILYKREGRSDVFTSNFSLDGIAARDTYAERITSRIAGAARIVSLRGPDRRLNGSAP